MLAPKVGSSKKKQAAPFNQTRRIDREHWQWLEALKLEREIDNESNSLRCGVLHRRREGLLDLLGF